HSLPFSLDLGPSPAQGGNELHERLSDRLLEPAVAPLTRLVLSAQAGRLLHPAAGVQDGEEVGNPFAHGGARREIADIGNRPPDLGTNPLLLLEEADVVPGTELLA